MASSGATRPTVTWPTRLEDLDGSLAADFEGSLSGLGVELGAEHYNMSEALLALPVFQNKRDDDGSPTTHALLTVQNNTNDEDGAGTIIQIQDAPQFQYILCACTSPATKINEETLTYLNQGQSYQIKLKRRLPSSEGQLFRSTIKVSFHERRLQYMEQEQMETWSALRQGERMLDIDLPTSHGIMDIILDPASLHMAQFTWDPTKDNTCIFVKLNCISTEFTPRKHGGEKGVPFRIQIETYTLGDNPSIIHCAACQVKVFKPKGADRKNKTDREKMDKKMDSDRQNFQPSYECTVLTEIPVQQVLSEVEHRKQVFLNYRTTSSNNPLPTPSFNTSQMSSLDDSVASSSSSVLSPGIPTVSQQSPDSNPPNVYDGEPLPAGACAKLVAQWLIHNRFSNYVRIFQHFTGADLMKLTRDDLIQICGLADGIRLNNAITSKCIRPRLTVYVCQLTEQIYHAIYLETPHVNEFMLKLAHLFGLERKSVAGLYFKGPNDIHVLVTDEVVANIQDESRFLIEAQQVDEQSGGDRYQFILKPVT